MSYRASDFNSLVKKTENIKHGDSSPPTKLYTVPERPCATNFNQLLFINMLLNNNISVTEVLFLLVRWKHKDV
jgi:hypothetical protein